MLAHLKIVNNFWFQIVSILKALVPFIDAVASLAPIPLNMSFNWSLKPTYIEIVKKEGQREQLPVLLQLSAVIQFSSWQEKEMFEGRNNMNL